MISDKYIMKWGNCLRPWQWIIFWGMVVLVLSGCTITFSPHYGVDWRAQPYFVTPEPVVTSLPIPHQIQPNTSDLFAAYRYGWVMADMANSDQPQAIDVRIDHLISARAFDESYLSLEEDPSGSFISKLDQYGLSLEDGTLDYAVVYNSEPGFKDANWTLYFNSQSEIAMIPTHVFPYSTFSHGTPYTITNIVTLGDGLANGDANCGDDVIAGIKCLQEHIGTSGGLDILDRPAAFLLFTFDQDGQRVSLMSWFQITPRGELRRPADSDSICGFCEQVCDGQGWCRWICPVCSLLD